MKSIKNMDETTLIVIVGIIAYAAVSIVAMLVSGK